MSSKTRIQAIATAVALALGGTAMANTTLSDTPTSGDLIFNLIDTVNGQSFLFDTGITSAAWTGNSAQSFSFSNVSGSANFDTNYAAFLTAAGTDTLAYSVDSATINPNITPKTEALNFTVQTGTPSVVTHSALSSAETSIRAFYGNSNTVASTTTNSAFLAPINGWGQNQYEGTTTGALGFGQTSLPFGDSALLGTAMAFYQESAVGNLTSTIASSTLSAYAGQWNFLNGTLTYWVGGSTVPLPMPLVLLLSGLGTMGIMARRGKASSADKGMFGTAAAG